MIFGNSALAAAVVILSSSAAATAPPRLGAPFPGATITEPAAVRGCKTRYKFVARAPLETVAAFYIAEARAARLPAVGDLRQKVKGFRLLVFKDGSGRYLSAVLNDEKAGVSGTVETTAKSMPRCG